MRMAPEKKTSQLSVTNCKQDARDENFPALLDLAK